MESHPEEWLLDTMIPADSTIDGMMDLIDTTQETVPEDQSTELQSIIDKAEGQEPAKSFLIPLPQEMEKTIPYVVGIVPQSAFLEQHLESGGRKQIHLKLDTGRFLDSSSRTFFPSLDLESALVSGGPLDSNSAIQQTSETNPKMPSAIFRKREDSIFIHSSTLLTAPTSRSLLFPSNNIQSNINTPVEVRKSEASDVHVSFPRQSLTKPSNSIESGIGRVSTSSRLTIPIKDHPLATPIIPNNHDFTTEQHHNSLKRGDTFHSLQVPSSTSNPRLSTATPASLVLFKLEQQHDERLYIRIDPETALSAIQEYQPTRADEIIINMGDKLRVIHQFKDGWILGYNLNLGVTGIFPMECLQSNITFDNTILDSPKARPSMTNTPMVLKPEIDESQDIESQEDQNMDLLEQQQQQKRRRLLIILVCFVITILVSVLGLSLGKTVNL